MEPLAAKNLVNRYVNEVPNWMDNRKLAFEIMVNSLTGVDESEDEDDQPDASPAPWNFETIYIVAGAMGVSAKDLREMSVGEFAALNAGYRQANGEPVADKPPTLEESAAMMEAMTKAGEATENG